MPGAPCLQGFLSTTRPLTKLCGMSQLYLERVEDKTSQTRGLLMSSAFIQAAIILLREGLEAILVIAALAGYLTKAGAGHRIQALYGGSLAAVGASIIAAWLFVVLNSGQHSDVLQGIFILLLSHLVTYVNG